MNDFWKENDLDGFQGDLRVLGHPQRPRQAQPWGVQQVPFIFIKLNIWNMFMKDIWKENDLDGFQGDLRALGHPQRPRQAQPRRVQQVPVMFIKMDELDEVAEGVRELLDHPVSHWDCFQLICHWKIAYKHVSCQFWMNITSTCCTRLCWACRGCWGCSRASWSPSTRMTSLWILMKY